MCKHSACNGLFSGMVTSPLPHCGKSWAAFGDLTYASYLIHFPLQIVMHGLFKRYAFFNPDQPATLIAFVISTYALAYLTYRFFELPAKNYLRDWLT
ncbi:hypothetical protein [Dyadobacter fermentans]|uniref:hypothetical protein n=1 Tax=Dyadobacter fermentans TaxID=94254 RepID=UPI001651B09E|nr:hypothetical protein [Dyadobacter fermentans]